ncbi:MAG: SRPBCC domain-containing protein [Chloroflexota bacterium]|nr:SRPBCC domain-containing protein [Chloroflexota bacterium]
MRYHAVTCNQAVAQGGPYDDDGKLVVRRSVEIDAPPERVWQEFESAERMRLWYTPAGGVEMPCKRLDFEPHVGGKFETEGYHGRQNSKQTFAFTGRVRCSTLHGS